MKGRKRDARHKPVFFKGGWPHATMQFIGTRYLVVAFAGKGTEDSDDLKAKLQERVEARATRKIEQEERDN